MADITVEDIQNVPLFDGLTGEALEPLLPAMRRVQLDEGEVLFREGDPGDALYIVEKGELRVGGSDSEQGGSADIVGPRQAIGELALLDGAPRAATAEALSDAALIALDRETFAEHLRRDPDLALDLIRQMAHAMRKRVVASETWSEHELAGRLAHVILFLAERDGRIEPGLVTNTLRARDLAEAIGASIEWVMGQLHEWNSEGIIGMTGPRRLILHDPEALKQISRREE